MTKPKTKDEIEAALNRLSGEYDYYCGVTSRKELDRAREEDEKNPQAGGAARRAYERSDAVIAAEYRSKLKALYWVLGQGDL